MIAYIQNSAICPKLGVLLTTRNAEILNLKTNFKVWIKMEENGNISVDVKALNKELEEEPAIEQNEWRIVATHMRAHAHARVRRLKSSLTLTLSFILTSQFIEDSGNGSGTSLTRHRHLKFVPLRWRQE